MFFQMGMKNLSSIRMHSGFAKTSCKQLLNFACLLSAQWFHSSSAPKPDFLWLKVQKRVLTSIYDLTGSLGSKYVISKLTAITINCCVQFEHLPVSNICFKFAIGNTVILLFSTVY